MATDSPSPFLAIEREGKGTTVHRATCKRAPERAVRVTPDELAVWARPIKLATCCKPRLDVPEPATTAVAATVAIEGGLREDRMERLQAAEAEAKLVKAWKRNGSPGTRPATPNLDAINAEAGQATRTPTGARAGNGNGHSQPRAGRQLTERQAQVKAIMDGNVAAGHSATWRPERGKRISDEDLTVYMRAVRLAHEDEGKTQLYNWAYFVDRLAITYERWMAFWPNTAP